MYSPPPTLFCSPPLSGLELSLQQGGRLFICQAQSLVGKAHHPMGQSKILGDTGKLTVARWESCSTIPGRTSTLALLFMEMSLIPLQPSLRGTEWSEWGQQTLFLVSESTGHSPQMAGSYWEYSQTFSSPCSYSHVLLPGFPLLPRAILGLKSTDLPRQILLTALHSSAARIPIQLFLLSPILD